MTNERIRTNKLNERMKNYTKGATQRIIAAAVYQLKIRYLTVEDHSMQWDSNSLFK